ncbi:MAG: DUF5989 family protein [Pseudomonadota bacterium]
MSLSGRMWAFLRIRKKWWLVPIIIWSVILAEAALLLHCKKEVVYYAYQLISEQYHAHRRRVIPSELGSAVRRKDLTAVQRLLNEESHLIGGFTNPGYTLLMHAIAEGHWDAAKFLVQRGVAVESPTGRGKTPLMYASSGGNLEVVRLLLERGAKVNARTGDGMTPLMYASSGGSLEVVRLLLERGAKVNASLFRGKRTALEMALRNGHSAIAEMLVAHGATKRTRDSGSGRDQDTRR